MTRQIDFTGELGAAQFALLYEMWLTGAAIQQATQAEGKPGQRLRDLAQMRAERRVTQAIKALSVEAPPRREGEAPLRVFSDTGTRTLALQQDAHALLLRYLEAAAPVMPVIRTDEVLEVIDLVDAADKIGD